MVKNVETVPTLGVGFEFSLYHLTSFVQIPAIKAIVEDCTKKISELSPVVEVARQQIGR